MCRQCRHLQVQWPVPSSYSLCRSKATRSISNYGETQRPEGDENKTCKKQMTKTQVVGIIRKTVITNQSSSLSRSNQKNMNNRNQQPGQQSMSISMFRSFSRRRHSSSRRCDLVTCRSCCAPCKDTSDSIFCGKEDSFNMMS